MDLGPFETASSRSATAGRIATIGIESTRRWNNDRGNEVLGE